MLTTAASDHPETRVAVVWPQQPFQPNIISGITDALQVFGGARAGLFLGCGWQTFGCALVRITGSIFNYGHKPRWVVVWLVRPGSQGGCPTLP